MPQTVRVYAVVSPLDLAALRDSGVVDLSERGAHAVTDRVRRAFPGDDEDDLEYAALWDAADAAVSTPDTARTGGPLSTANTDDPAGIEQQVSARIVVVAADVPQSWVGAVAEDDDADPDLAYRVTLDRPLPRTSIVSLHVAAEGAGPDDELLWHDVTELAAVAQTI